MFGGSSQLQIAIRALLDKFYFTQFLGYFIASDIVPEDCSTLEELPAGLCSTYPVPMPTLQLLSNVPHPWALNTKGVGLKVPRRSSQTTSQNAQLRAPPSPLQTAWTSFDPYLHSSG